MTFILEIDRIREARAEALGANKLADHEYSLAIHKAMFTALHSIVNSNPDIREFYWAQVYDPVIGFRLIVTHLIEMQKSPARNDILEIFQIFTAEEFRLIFGDHKMIRVSRRGIEVDIFEDPSV